MTGPLDGIRIIDLSQMASGPFATAQLADQGADVIKVEPLGLGDAMRGFPSFAKGGVSAVMASLNRGKRSISLDLGTDAGVEVVRSLASDADVFLQNFRPGVIERMGLAPDDLRAANPKLITVSVSGYGLAGPMKHLPVFDPVIQAITGQIAFQVNPKIPFPDLIRHVVVDKSTANAVAQAITAALFHRERTSEAQHIDLSMVDAALNFFWPDGMMSQTFLDDDATGGMTIADLYSLTDCADGQIVYFAGTLPQRMGLFRALGRPEWCDDERFNQLDLALHPENFALLGQMMGEAFAAMSAAEATEALNTNDVPCGLVTAVADVPDHPQIVAAESLVEFDDPTAGRVRQPRPAARFSASTDEPRWNFPLRGEQTDEILAEAGVDAAGIAVLRADGVID
ncbi:MAG: crotonobetainyl-CoA:carnitine CoA-transferase CaiB-like acyl-CoA transferase [Candidatus Aldehydirespiratoraceae bacterium]|jgi:crotonobetainyl-CoA:carnitine CoA-transferase CaiB-like acyl-CoA transferase